MKSAFVTGGSGFLGRHLIRGLARQGVTVRALARSRSASAAVEALGAKSIGGDLDDLSAMEAGMRGVDVVFHAAAFAKQHGTRQEFFHANVTGTEHVLSTARSAGVRRLVHIGTEAVLASGKPIVGADENLPRARHPAGLYPLTKGLAEARVLAANSPELQTVVVRPRLIWGPDDTSVLAELVETVRSGRFAWIAGGHYLTSTCHVDNVVEGAILAATRGRPGEIYFLTDGEPVEFRSFIGALLRTQGVDPGTREVPRWLVRLLAALTGWMRTPPITKTAVALAGVEVTVRDHKARRELGYVGQTTREAGLRALASGQVREAAS
jgi:nucleoside-diphosphate-sugar epimerase